YAGETPPGIAGPGTFSAPGCVESFDAAIGNAALRGAFAKQGVAIIYRSLQLNGVQGQVAGEGTNRDDQRQRASSRGNAARHRGAGGKGRGDSRLRLGRMWLRLGALWNGRRG